MILPDHEIRKHIQDGRIGIEPQDGIEERIHPACLYLRLGDEFRLFKYTQEAFIDSRNPKSYTEEIKTEGKPIILHPKEFLLGITYEKVRLPADIAAYVDGRSSLGRLGITAHITSSLVDPGFDGKLVLEISNLGKMPVTLYPGMKVCKLVFFKLFSPAETPYNKLHDAKYRGQAEVVESRIYKDEK
ncbi:MAG: dCTP deaminase [Candidatus Aenigmarchaeota archaeon]|nr:dCTP deaminase [Candidatus Aenigmarchaeota archaeon]